MSDVFEAEVEPKTDSAEFVKYLADYWEGLDTFTRGQVQEALDAFYDMCDGKW